MKIKSFMASFLLLIFLFLFSSVYSSGLLDIESWSWWFIDAYTWDLYSWDLLSWEMPSYLDQVSIQVSLSFWDIQIVEIFPGSWLCLDEHIILHSMVYYSGSLQIVWLGQSTDSIFISVELHTWEFLYITDNLTSLIYTWKLIVVDSVTLTNAGEGISLHASGIVLDSIYYTDPRWPKSLFYGSISGTVRYFNVVADASTKTNCTLFKEFQSQPWNDWCDISLVWHTALGSGLYALDFAATGAAVSWCDDFTWMPNPLSKWYINGVQVWENQCILHYLFNPWFYDIDIKIQDANWSHICWDQLLFASAYELWALTQFKQSSLQCQTNKDSQTSKTSSSKESDTIIFQSKNCWMKLQSPSLGFYFGSNVNIALLLDDVVLTDSQKKFACEIDFWNGDIIYECNPKGYRYALPWVYTIRSSIMDIESHQSVCKNSFFLNIPSTKLAAIKEEMPLSPWNNNWAPMSWFCENSGIFISSIVASPKGSDATGEQIIFGWFQPWEDYSDYYVFIKKKKFFLNAETSAIGYITWWLWLINNGLCFSLFKEYCGLIQEVCYWKTKEGQEMHCGEWKSVSCTIGSWLLSLSWVIKDANLYNVSNKLSCDYKVKALKLKDKIAYEKLKSKHATALLKLEDKYAFSLESWRNKERYARNAQYLYKNALLYYDNYLKKNRFGLYNELGISDVLVVSNKINTLQLSGLIYSHKETKKYKYTNDFKKTISKYENRIFPLWMFDVYFEYLDKLELQFVNKKI